MFKKIGIVLVLFGLTFSQIFGQAFGTVDHAEQDEVLIIDTERGFTAQVEMNSNMFQMTMANFSDEVQRFRRSGYSLINNYPFGNINVLDGTSVGFAYNAEWFGGTLSVNSGGLGGVRAWVSFFDDMIKVTAGNDIRFTFANSQGAGAGLRVYDDRVRNVAAVGSENPTIDSNINPDDITQGSGILFELDLDSRGIAPVVIAFAGGGNPLNLGGDHGSFQFLPTGSFTARSVYGKRMQYGANIGTIIGDIARFNVSYIWQHEIDQTLFQYIEAEDIIVPRGANTEITNHVFGSFGSFYPFRDDSLGITIGYAGILVQYLEEFSFSAVTGSAFQTVMPQVFKHGINFAARFRHGSLTLVTDHNFSFWTDKNYRIFNLHSPDPLLTDHGLRSADTAAADIANVNHTFLWNGFGISYQFTPGLEGTFYARNLLRIDETPQFRMLNSYFSVEARANFRLGSTVEAWAGIVYQYTWRTVNQELNERVNEFPSGNTAADTVDTLSMFQIPIGLRVRLQRGN
ncbi:MAG: hypothetical protein FWC97_02245 [Treponema sp.]|nr:hypothetical protein [Treponema sp.]